jgi:ribose 5-phosphate isomerase B
VCVDAETAKGARRWNDANVLALSLRSSSEAVAREIVDAFIATAVDDTEHSVIERLDDR